MMKRTWHSPMPTSVSFCRPGNEAPDNTWELVAYADGHICEAADTCKRIARWRYNGHYFCVGCGEKMRSVMVKLAGQS